MRKQRAAAVIAQKRYIGPWSVGEITQTPITYLWREPKDIASENLFYGRGGRVPGPVHSEIHLPVIRRYENFGMALCSDGRANLSANCVPDDAGIGHDCAISLSAPAFQPYQNRIKTLCFDAMRLSVERRADAPGC